MASLRSQWANVNDQLQRFGGFPRITPSPDYRFVTASIRSGNFPLADLIKAGLTNSAVKLDDLLREVEMTHVNIQLDPRCDPEVLSRLFSDSPYFPIGENHFRLRRPHLPIPQLKQILRNFNREFKRPQLISLWNESYFCDLYEAPPPPPPPAPKKGHYFIEGLSLEMSDADIRSVLAAVGAPAPTPDGPTP